MPTSPHFGLTLTALLPSRPPAGVLPAELYKAALVALEAGVSALAAPDCCTPIQARAELLNAASALYSALREALDVDDVLAVLRWLDAFARYPYSADDPPPIPGALPAGTCRVPFSLGLTEPSGC